MISECINPRCREPLRYLRSGRVVRVVTGSDDQVRVEHFWLCGECHRTHEFHFLPDGTVTLVRRTVVEREQVEELDLTLVA